jgi:formylglycine-generating enzyme required for sulfatase activity
MTPALSRRLPCLAAFAGLACALLPLLSRAERPKAPRAITNSIGMKLVLIPAGKFLMGSPPTEKGRSSNEGPQHKVQISRPFYLGVYEVTQAQYQKVMGSNPSCFSATGGGKDQVKGLDTANFPVEQVSWHDAVAFCNKLSALPAEKRRGRV